MDYQRRERAYYDALQLPAAAATALDAAIEAAMADLRLTLDVFGVLRDADAWVPRYTPAQIAAFRAAFAHAPNGYVVLAEERLDAHALSMALRGNEAHYTRLFGVMSHLDARRYAYYALRRTVRVDVAALGTFRRAGDTDGATATPASPKKQSWFARLVHPGPVYRDMDEYTLVLDLVLTYIDRRHRRDIVALGTAPPPSVAAAATATAPMPAPTAVTATGKTRVVPAPADGFVRIHPKMTEVRSLGHSRSVSSSSGRAATRTSIPPLRLSTSRSTTAAAAVAASSAASSSSSSSTSSLSPVVFDSSSSSSSSSSSAPLDTTATTITTARDKNTKTRSTSSGSRSKGKEKEKERAKPQPSHRHGRAQSASSRVFMFESPRATAVAAVTTLASSRGKRDD